MLGAEESLFPGPEGFNGGTNDEARVDDQDRHRAWRGREGRREGGGGGEGRDEIRGGRRAEVGGKRRGGGGRGWGGVSGRGEGVDGWSLGG